MVTSSDAVTLRDHTFTEAVSNTSVLSSNDSARGENQISAYSSITVLEYKLKAKLLFALQAVCFYMQIFNLMMIRDQKKCCANVVGHWADHESWSAMLLQTWAGLNFVVSTALHWSACSPPAPSYASAASSVDGFLGQRHSPGRHRGQSFSAGVRGL